MDNTRMVTLARTWAHVTITVPISSGNASLLSDLIVAGTIIAPTGDTLTITSPDILSAVVSASASLGLSYGGKLDNTPFTVAAGGTLSDFDIPAAYWPSRTWIRSSGASFTADVKVLIA